MAGVAAAAAVEKVRSPSETVPVLASLAGAPEAAATRAVDAF